MKRTRKFHHGPAISLTCLAFATTVVSAGAITIDNPSFEDPVLAELGTGAPAGWEPVNGGGDAFHPGTDQYPGGVPDGDNVASMYTPGDGDGLFQILSGPTALLQEGASYTLTVEVGDPADGTFGGYTIELRADGALLAGESDDETPPDGGFATATLQYTYNDTLHSGQLGKPLEIHLLSNGAGTETNFDNVQLAVAYANPIADPGSYIVFVGNDLSLDGSGSIPSDGETINTYEWDLDNDGDFDESVTGVTPATIPFATLTGTYGMVDGLNTIKLKVTDSAAKTSTVEGTVNIKPPVLVDEDWQDPLLGNGTALTTQFTGWNCISDPKSRREDNQGDVPGDSTVAAPNQIVQFEYTSDYLDYDLSHNWAATEVYHLRVEASPQSWNGDKQRYIRPELQQQDGTVLWSTAEDPTTAVPLYDDFGNLSDYPSELAFFFEIDASTFSTGTEGQPLRLRIGSSGQRGLYINNITLVVGPLPEDNVPPVPDPLTWDILPTVSNFKDISMRANSARDPDDLYGVEYYFENTTRGTNSGWQDSREWAENDLDYGTEYTYRVKARDKSPNLNESITWSTEESVTTESQDLTPPSPDPLTWDTLPEVADYRSITMSVNAANDVSGVEYYFENVTAGTNSGWQTARAWTEKDLDPATSYTYRARARDQSLGHNESLAWSAEESATTPTEPTGTLFITRFQDPLISDGTGSPDLGDWVLGGGNASNVKIQKATGDGVRTDTDLPTPGDNRVVQFEYTGRTMTYDIAHNWSSSDTFTLTLNASPQSWNGDQQRYVRPSLRQQDGTELWAPGENMTGPERTAVPLYSSLAGSSYQDDPNLTFSYTIPASAFSSGAEGGPIALRIDSSGFRGLFIDNVHLSVTTGGGGGNTFANWLAGYTLTDTGFDGDDDGDEIGNGLEGLFGTAPDVFNAGLAGLAKSGNTVTFTHPNPETPLTDVAGSYEWSLDLSNWNASGDTVNGTTVNIAASADDPVAGTTTVTCTIPDTVPDGFFVRAVATRE